MAKRGSKSRHLTAQEQLLWQKITKDVVSHQPISMANGLTMVDELTKLSLEKPQPRRKLKSTAAPISSSYKADPLEKGHLLKLMQRFDDNTHPAHNQSIKPSKSAATHHYHSAHQHHQKPQNLPLDRNIRQKLQRGRADIEARLDLHGFNRDNAHTRLMSFLRSSHQQGFKTVIVVTGKGDGSIARHSLHSADFFQMPEQRAVLRASIGDWLNSAEAEQFVIGWQPAHPKHGGGGAVYVRLRSQRR